MMQQRLVEKEKASKEEHLRMLAQRAREERGGVVVSGGAGGGKGVGVGEGGGGGAVLKSSLAAYGSDDGSESGSGSDKEGRSDKDSAEDEEARKVRDEMRAEKRREREREMRMNNMGTEQRAKMLARYVFFIYMSLFLSSSSPFRFRFWLSSSPTISRFPLDSRF